MMSPYVAQRIGQLSGLDSTDFKVSKSGPGRINLSKHTAENFAMSCGSHVEVKDNGKISAELDRCYMWMDDISTVQEGKRSEKSINPEEARRLINSFNTTHSLLTGIVKMFGLCE
jgi:hypothetical protein